jgi:hypothetical protein
VIRLDAATVLAQWATGGLAFLWFTSRRGIAGPGYSWLLRGWYSLVGAGAVASAVATEVVVVREVAAVALVVVTVATVRRRRHVVDLVAPAIGVVGIIAGAVAAADGAGDVAVSVARVLVGAAFLGAISDAMLLGHWYLVQPGMPRRLLNEMVTALLWILPLEVAVMLMPTGMGSVLTGAIDDGWGGVLGWFWVACAVTTGALCVVTRAALRERSYSAVMAATGLLYLAILTAFGTDLVARATLA